MQGTKAEILAQLKKDILSLETNTASQNICRVKPGLDLLENAFPNSHFTLGAIHEFISTRHEESSATCGFISGILAAIMQHAGAAIWISTEQRIFPPALKAFSLSPERFIFISLKKENDILWALEESLKCEGLSAVIAEVSELSFTASRRLQLAVEKSRVTGFILRNNPRQLNTTASNTRWRIRPIASYLPGRMPGVGFPSWNIELLKVRNGRTGTWQLSYCDGRFRPISSLAKHTTDQIKKTG